VSCQHKIQPEEVSKLNGYWEIEKVTFDKGDNKEYKVNESFDYFEITNNKGIRKKVMPHFDGTFMVNGTYENVVVRFDNEQVFLDYSTPYSKWSEEIIELSDKELVVKNAEKKEYHYKKAGPINLTQDGEKTK
jgi:hypothetical protein